jgi:hypothetical protein
MMLSSSKKRGVQKAIETIYKIMTEEENEQEL